MDAFAEKIITRKKTRVEYFIMGLLFTIWLFLSVFFIFLFSLGFLLDVLMLLGLYYLLKGMNVEYEYAVTNGELDIDRITAKSKRKRIFSANCKDFEILARASNENFNEAKNIKNIIKAVSSDDSPDIYFIVLHYKESKTLVLFEPDEIMLKTFKNYIPKKVLN